MSETPLGESVPISEDSWLSLWSEQIRTNTAVWFTASLILVLVPFATGIGIYFALTIFANDVLGWQPSDAGYPFKFFLLGLIPISFANAIAYWLTANYHLMAARCLHGESFAAENLFERPKRPLDLFLLGTLYFTASRLIDLVPLPTPFKLSPILWILVGPLLAFVLPSMVLENKSAKQALVGSIKLARKGLLQTYAVVWGSALFAALGLLACGFGSFFTLPAYYLAVTRLFLVQSQAGPGQATLSSASPVSR